MVNKLIHFNFGFASDFGGKPFGLVHYLAIKSAKIVNKCEVQLYYQYAPTNNEWWDKAMKYCTPIHCTPQTEIHGHRLSHVAFISDVFRLKILNEQGGIYLDCDTICVHPLDEFLHSDFVMGVERTDKVIGLCNAVMMASANSEFGAKWWESYRDYDPRWGVMSVVKPFSLATENRHMIRVLPPDTFFKYTWKPSGLKQIFEDSSDVTGIYVLHLWEQVSYAKYLQSLTFEDIKQKDTTYNFLARPFVE